MLWTGFIPGAGAGGGGLCYLALLGGETKSLDGRSLSFSKMGIIIHWAAETIWWNAGPGCSSGLHAQKADSMPVQWHSCPLSLSHIWFEARLPGSTLSLHLPSAMITPSPKLALRSSLLLLE